MNGLRIQYGHDDHEEPKEPAKPFKDRGEAIAAMSDPRYKRDTAFQREVARRLAVTDDDMGANQQLDGYAGECDLLDQVLPGDPNVHFRSQQELVKAMLDPRYKTDPAYRYEVAEKIYNVPDGVLDERKIAFKNTGPLRVTMSTGDETGPIKPEKEERH